jgi:hypothetical protein
VAALESPVNALTGIVPGAESRRPSCRPRSNAYQHGNGEEKARQKRCRLDQDAKKTRKGAAPPCKSLSTLLHAAVSAAGTRDL